jgi:hypothetical protein
MQAYLFPRQEFRLPLGVIFFMRKPLVCEKLPDIGHIFFIEIANFIHPNIQHASTYGSRKCGCKMDMQENNRS